MGGTHPPDPATWEEDESEVAGGGVPPMLQGLEGGMVSGEREWGEGKREWGEGNVHVLLWLLYSFLLLHTFGMLVICDRGLS